MRDELSVFDPSFRFLPSGKVGSRRPSVVHSDPCFFLTSGVKSDRFQSCRSGFGPASGAGDPEDLKRPTESDRTKVGMSGNPKTYRARLDRNPENGQMPTQAAAADSKEAKSWDDGLSGGQR